MPFRAFGAGRCPLLRPALETSRKYLARHLPSFSYPIVFVPIRNPKRPFRSPKRPFRTPKRPFRTPKRPFRTPKQPFRSPKRSFRTPFSYFCTRKRNAKLGDRRPAGPRWFHPVSFSQVVQSCSNPDFPSVVLSRSTW